MKHTLNIMQRGQILLITLLVLAFAVTVGLAIISRSTTDVSISNQQEDSAKAFNAAEAGIEEGLKLTTDTAKTLSGGSSYSVTVANVGGAAGIYTFPTLTTKGTTETVWLVNHNADGSLNETRVFSPAYVDLCWTKPAATIPAMVATIVYKRGTGYLVAKGAYDGDATRASSNKFSSATSSPPNNYCSRLTFAGFGIDPTSDTLLMLRARPVYADTTITINTTATLPLQGKRVESTGTTPNGTTRKIVVFQQYRSADSFFDAALYSQLNLVK